MVPNEVKDYLHEYGKTPVPVDDAFRRSIIDDAVITDRPADHPDRFKLKTELGDLQKVSPAGCWASDGILLCKDPATAEVCWPI